MTVHSNLAHAPQSPAPEAPPSDAYLLSATARGDDKAYAQVVKRHYSAGRLLAMLLESDGAAARNLLRKATTGAKAALRRGEGPTVAFRPYFLTAIHQLHTVQHSSADSVRIDARDPGRPVVLGAPEPWQGLPVVQAYQFLPETMQMVLWHQSVENLPPHDIAELLGMTTGRVKLYLAAANAELIRLSVAQFDLPADDACQHTIPLLPRFIADTVSALEYRDVVTHIEFCDSCWSTVRALESIGTGLRARLGAWILGAHADQYLEALAASGTVVNPATASLDAVVAKDLPTGPPTSSDLNLPGPTITIATAENGLAGARSGAQRVTPQAKPPAEECPATPTSTSANDVTETVESPDVAAAEPDFAEPETASKIYDIADLMAPQGAEGTDFAVLAEPAPAAETTDVAKDTADNAPGTDQGSTAATPDLTTSVDLPTPDATAHVSTAEPPIDLVAVMNQVAAIAAALPQDAPAPTPGTDVSVEPPEPAKHQTVILPPQAQVAAPAPEVAEKSASATAPDSLPSTVSTRMIDLPHRTLPTPSTVGKPGSAADTAGCEVAAAPVKTEAAAPAGNWLQVAAHNTPRLPVLSTIVAKADPTLTPKVKPQPAAPVSTQETTPAPAISRRPRLADISTETTGPAWQHGDIKRTPTPSTAPTSWWTGVRTKVSSGELSPTIILVIGLVLTLVLGSSFLILLKQALSGM